jgi:hypothetical protein
MSREMADHSQHAVIAHIRHEETFKHGISLTYLAALSLSCDVRCPRCPEALRKFFCTLCTTTSITSYRGCLGSPSDRYDFMFSPDIGLIAHDFALVILFCKISTQNSSSWIAVSGLGWTMMACTVILTTLSRQLCRFT